MANITFEKIIEREELEGMLRKIVFRGLYDRTGNLINPYKNVKFSLATLLPRVTPQSQPKIKFLDNPDKRYASLFTPQPTIYKTQTNMLRHVDEFLITINKRVFSLDFEAIQYSWEGRGRYQIIPPIIEKHNIPLKEGFFDLDKIIESFKDTYIKDAKGEFHSLNSHTLKDYFVDNESKINYLDVFNKNVSLINYGLNFSGRNEFYIICDGAHRIDLAIEYLNKPTNIIIAEAIDDTKPMVEKYCGNIDFSHSSKKENGKRINSNGRLKDNNKKDYQKEEENY